MSSREVLVDTCAMRRVVLAALISAGVVVGACGGSDYTYVKNSSQKVYFRIPGDWKFYGADDVIEAQIDAGAFTPDQADDFKREQWMVAFDAGRAPKAFVDFLDAQAPRGFARSRALGAEERDTYSLQSLRNEVVDLDQAQAAGALEVVDFDELEVGRYHGVHFVVQLRDSTTSKFLTLEQTSLLDLSTKRVHTLVIGCARECFDKHARSIHAVNESWTVR